MYISRCHLVISVSCAQSTVIPLFRHEGMHLMIPFQTGNISNVDRIIWQN